VLATALLAGLAALALGGPWQLQRSLSMGLVLGVVRESSRSLLPCLVLHAGFGVVFVLASFQAFGIPGFDDLTSAHTPILWLTPAALATGAGLRICQSLWRSAPADVPGNEP
jgi:hypothetical protein